MSARAALVLEDMWHVVHAGPDNPNSARQHAPDSIRALFGSDSIRNAAYGSGSVETAANELAFFFGSSGSSTAGAAVSTGVTYGSRSSRGGTASSSSGGSCGQSAAQIVSCCRGCGTTLGVVLPHAVKDGLAGLMLDEIQAGFQLTGLQQFSLPKQAAAEFLEVSISTARLEPKGPEKEG
jgi:nucleoside-diphosphate kinase